MGRAKIITAIGGGFYSADLDFNTEVIEFNLARFRLRQSDIENIDLPQAESDLATAEVTLADATAALNEAINQLSGKPSVALFAALNAVANALSLAGSFLTNTSTGLINAGTFISAASADLPGSPDPGAVAAINAAGTSTGLASGSVNDEANEVSTASSQTSSLISSLQVTEPDLSQALTDIAALLDQLNTVVSAHVSASSDINFAQGQTQAARNTLPGDISYDTSRADLDNALAAFVTTSAAHTAANAQYVVAQDQTGRAQELLTPGRGEANKAVKDAQKALNEAGNARAIARFNVDSLILELQELDNKITELETIPQTERKNLWCADLTEDLSALADVGTMEIPGEFGGTVQAGIGEALIRPGFAHDHLWNQARDGWITPCRAQTAAATFYNLAIMPGWQVFRPTFRFARVLKVNDDGTLKVGLISPNISSQQSIDVTPKDLPSTPTASPQTVNYDNVAVHYMDCDSQAFLEGDSVVVEYQQQQATRPRVIGFRSNPRSCQPSFLLAPQKTAQFSVSGNQWTIKTTDTPNNFGRRFWITRKHQPAVSWARGHGVDVPDFGLSSWARQTQSQYLSGVSYADALNIFSSVFVKNEEIPTPDIAMGGAIYKRTNGTTTLRVVVLLDSFDSGGVTATGMAFYERPYPLTAEDWTLRGTWTPELGGLPFNCVYFNETGDEAVFRAGASNFLEKIVSWGESSVSVSDGDDDVFYSDYYFAADGSNPRLRWTLTGGTLAVIGPYPYTTPNPDFERAIAVDLRIGLFLFGDEYLGTGFFDTYKFWRDGDYIFTGDLENDVDFSGQSLFSYSYGIDANSLHIALHLRKETTYSGGGAQGVYGDDYYLQDGTASELFDALSPTFPVNSVTNDFDQLATTPLALGAR